tara:strand:+ start:573 stop:1349 length:777 start_codon:yes stop_codon:yes gene_type:complete
VEKSNYIKTSATEITKETDTMSITDEINDDLCEKIQNIKLNEEINKELDEEKQLLLNIVKQTFDIYLYNGGRSKKKTDYLHGQLKDIIQKCIPEYDVKIEAKVNSVNATGCKSCDIVAYKNKLPCIIFPVKFIMTNYYQNKNNSWENLTGELFQIKKANKDIQIVPINIIFNNIPYCEQSSLIKKYEKITYEKTYKITENLIEWELASNIVNYIIDVEQECKIGEKYDKCPKIIGFNKDTPYRLFSNILKPIIQPQSV